MSARFRQIALWLSLMVNLTLAVLASGLWLDRRAARLGLDTKVEALKSVFGAFLLSRAQVAIRVAEASPGPGLTPVDVPPTGERFYVAKGESETNRDIDSARVAETPYGGYEVQVFFTSEGAVRIKRLTEQNIKKRLIFSVDGKPLIAPVIMEPIDQGFTKISGAFTKDEAKRIVIGLSRR